MVDGSIRCPSHSLVLIGVLVALVNANANTLSSLFKWPSVILSFQC